MGFGAARLKEEDEGAVSVEERRRQAQLDRERLRETAEHERREVAMRDAHLKSLVPCDICSVPWRTAVRAQHIYGGCGGVELVEFEGGTAVCLKPQLNFAVAEFLADRIARAFDVSVARLQVIAPKDERSEQISDVLRKLSPHSQGSGKFNLSLGLYGIVEFVPGFMLLGPQAHKALSPPSPAFLTELGRICAFDALINNMDRLPLPLWDCAGNLKNVMVRASDGGVVGIDQSVRPITNEVGMQRYLCRVRGLAADLLASGPGGRTDQGPAAIGVRLRHRFAQDCGAELSSDSLELLLEGLRAGLLRAAELWESGALLRCLDTAEAEASELFGPDVAARLQSILHLARSAAAEIWAGARGIPVPSVLASRSLTCPAQQLQSAAGDVDDGDQQGGTSL